MPGITEPVPRPLQHCLRAGVLGLATSERRRRFPVTVLLGVPGHGDVRYVVDDGALDHDLRTEVVAALLGRWSLRASGGTLPAVSAPAGPDVTWPMLWLHRPGDLQTSPIDLAWLAAAAAGYAEHGLTLSMVVMTRHGWLDPRTGTARQWVRLRRRS